MNWETPSLLIFLLLFSFGVSESAAGTNFQVDSNGVRHYVLTQQVSDFDKFQDRLTNVLFTKHDNPWVEPEQQNAPATMAFSIFLLSLVSIVNASQVARGGITQIMRIEFSQRLIRTLGCAYFSDQTNLSCEKTPKPANALGKNPVFTKYSTKKFSFLLLGLFFSLFIFPASSYGQLTPPIQITESPEVSETVNIPALLPAIIARDTPEISDSVNIPDLVPPIMATDAPDILEGVNIPSLVMPIMATDIPEVSESSNIPTLVPPIMAKDTPEILDSFNIPELPMPIMARDTPEISDGYNIPDLVPPIIVSDVPLIEDHAPSEGFDEDGDGITDNVDNCMYDANPGQEDLDGDGIGDVCDGSFNISTDTVLTNDFVFTGNLVVENNSLVTIGEGVTVTIPPGKNITIQSGSGVLIKEGGTLQINS